MDIGKRVRTARKSAGLSQEALARQAEMSLRALNSLERGESSDPHYSTLVGIADALDMSIGELLGEPVPLAEAPEAGPPDTSETIADTVHDLVLKQDRREAQALNRLSESQQMQVSFGHDDHKAMMYLLGLPKGSVEEAYIDLMRSHVCLEQENARLREELARVHVND